MGGRSSTVHADLLHFQGNQNHLSRKLDGVDVNDFRCSTHIRFCLLISSVKVWE